MEFSVRRPSPPNTYSYVREENLGSMRKSIEIYLLFTWITNLILAIHLLCMGWRNLSKTVEKEFLQSTCSECLFACWQVSNNCTSYVPASKNGNFPILVHCPSKCRNKYVCTQKTSTMLADCKNTMNHGGRHHTTAAIVPHPRLRGIGTLANVLYNKAT